MPRISAIRLRISLLKGSQGSVARRTRIAVQVYDSPAALDQDWYVGGACRPNRGPGCLGRVGKHLANVASAGAPTQGVGQGMEQGVGIAVSDRSHIVRTATPPNRSVRPGVSRWVCIPIPTRSDGRGELSFLWLSRIEPNFGGLYRGHIATTRARNVFGACRTWARRVAFGYEKGGGKRQPRGLLKLPVLGRRFLTRSRQRLPSRGGCGNFETMDVIEIEGLAKSTSFIRNARG